MSYCIHKVVGYGIADLTVDQQGKITDQRIDPDGYLFHPEDGAEKYHLQKFFDLLCKKDPAKWQVELYSMDYYGSLLSECIHFGTSNGNCVLTICPPNKSHCWIRVDDVIDFCEEETCFNRQPHHSFIGHGIPSYRYLMDSRTGRQVPTITANEFLALSKAYKESKSDVERYRVENSLMELACDLKFATIDEASANLAPLVPEVVMEFCEFLRIFKDPKTALSLRPMIYSYWR